MARVKTHALNPCAEDLQKEINSLAVNILKTSINDFIIECKFVEMPNIMNSIRYPFWPGHHNPDSKSYNSKSS